MILCLQASVSCSVRICHHLKHIHSVSSMTYQETIRHRLGELSSTVAFVALVTIVCMLKITFRDSQKQSTLGHSTLLKCTADLHYYCRPNHEALKCSSCNMQKLITLYYYINMNKQNDRIKHNTEYRIFKRYSYSNEPYSLLTRICFSALIDYFQWGQTIVWNHPPNQISWYWHGLPQSMGGSSTPENVSSCITSMS